MRLDELTLRDFRNYRELKFPAEPGVNLIVGDNAQGKTNLLEAIAFLGSGRSFRTQKSAELIRFGAEAAVIDGKIDAQARAQRIVWTLHAGKSRSLTCNGVKKRTAAQLGGLFPCVLFCPEDLLVLKTGADRRRRLCDHALCQLRPNYDAALAEYGRVLERKNRVLKDRFENPAVAEILPEYNARLCHIGARIISYRARYFDALGREAMRYHAAFSGGNEEFCLTYKTVSTVDDPFAATDVLEARLWEHLLAHERAEKESCQALSGPHRDDFDVALSGRSLKTYGSQGQVRTAAISLKLAQRAIMARESGETPVLLLDDVLSELDRSRQDFVLNQIRGGQVFITCCEPDRFTTLGKTVRIQDGQLAP